MTERSFLWDGIAVGDATLAPYDKENFNKWFSIPFASDNDAAYVVPGYLDSMEPVISDGGLPSLGISAGAALIRGYVYILDEATAFSFANNETDGYYRYDSIVLQVNWDEDVQTVKLVKLQGAESSTFPPEPPTLTQNESEKIWEVELFRVYIDSTDYAFYYKYLQDMRVFIRTYLDWITYPSANLIKNSEFMAFSGDQSAGVDYPEYWEGIGTPSAVVSGAALIPMLRGRSIDITGGGISQTTLYNKSGRVFSYRGLAEIVSGSALFSFHGIRSDGTNTKKEVEVYLGDTGEIQVFKGTVEFEEDDIEQLYVGITSTGTDQFYVGQIILAEGYHVGPFRQFQEVLMFRAPVTDTSWDGDFKSDGTTLIDLTASFDAVILPYTHAIILNLACRDSGSAAVNDNYIQVEGLPAGVVYGQNQIARQPADKRLKQQRIVPVDNNLRFGGDATPQFNITVEAQGVNTLDAWVDIVGIIT